MNALTNILMSTGSLRREWLPTPVLLAGEFHRQRSLAGQGSWGLTESDTTEAT